MGVVFRYGRFYVDYRPDGRHGKRVFLKLPETIQTEDEARAWEKEIKAAAIPERKKPELLENAMVDTLFPEYLSWYELFRARTTWHDLDRIYENHISRILGKEKLIQLNSHHIVLYQKKRKSEARQSRGEGGVSNRTIMKELNYFKGFLSWCRREKRMDIPPIRIEELPHERPLPIVLSPQEVVRIIEAAEPIYKAMFLCLYSLGLRISEARNIRGQDIDLQTNTVRVVQKGGSYKMLPLNPWIRSVVAPLIPEDTKRFIFVNQRTGEQMMDIRKGIIRACKKAGVTKHVTPHLFRHSVATHFMAADVNLRTIQHYLGHAQVSTTEFYTHVAMGHLQTASNVLFKGITEGLSTDNPDK